MVKKRQKHGPYGFKASLKPPADNTTGKERRAKRKGYSLWGRVLRRRTCSSKCPIFDKCPFAYYSLRTEGRPCLLNRLATQEKKTIFKIAQGHEQAIDDAIRAYLGILAKDIIVKFGGDIELKRKLLYDLIAVKNAVFGQKQRVDVKAKVDIGKVLREIEEAMKKKEAGDENS